jgi:AcrR family transcriptional regulator
MPRSEETNERMRQRAYRAILDAALEVAAEGGFHAASMRKVAERAGVSKALIFKYFASKAELLRALLASSLVGAQQSFARAATVTTPRERLEALIGTGFDFVREHPDFWRLISQLRMQKGLRALVGNTISASVGGITQQLEDELRAQGTPDPHLDARVLFAAIDGATQHYLLDPEAYPLDEVKERLVSLFLHLNPNEETPT